MKHRVLLTDKAEANVAEVLAWFQKQRAAAAGSKWFQQLFAVIDTLETRAERCGRAAEADDLGLDIREIRFGKRRSVYRILFEIQDRTVHILCIRHSARDALSRDDLPET